MARSLGRPGGEHHLEPLPLLGGHRLGDEIVAAANERIAATVASAPGRLAGLATVALQHPERAASQLQDAMTRLGLRGVEISTAVDGRELDDRRLDPFWAGCEKLGAFVFIHPWGCSLGHRLATAYLGNIVGNPAETTVALSRTDHAYAERPESRTMARPPSEYLDSLCVDSLVYQPGELRRLAAVMGTGRVLLGTDFPFDMGVDDPVARVHAAPMTASHGMTFPRAAGGVHGSPRRRGREPCPRSGP